MNVTKNKSLFQIAVPVRIAAGPTARAKRSGVLRTLIRAAGSTLALMAAVAAIGATYESIAGISDRTTYTARGRLIDVGGYHMHLDCRGEGKPTVVMDAGLGGSSLDWSLVQADLAGTVQVCTYDRAGMGWSEVSPKPRTPKHIADELHLLLTNGGLSGPYVLVGHSLGGKTVRMFALAYADQVAGMVLVDARSELIDARIPKAEADAFDVALGMQGLLYAVARRFGVARAFGSGLAGVPLLSPATATEMALLMTQTDAIDETTREGEARSADDATLAKSTLGSMPLLVIASAASMAEIPNWPTAQRRLAELSTQGTLVVAEHAGHAVQLEDPGIVIDGVEQVLAGVRSDP
jgi:pimeloyl-ACP methyl ester carboxylesterase